jgi:hypothetical protein
MLGAVSVSMALNPGAAASARSPLLALSGVERGQWELRERGSTHPPRRLCISDPVQLLQPRHPGAICHRFVVSDGERRTVVTYQCTDSGTGRTDLRVETSRLVQIDAQGIADSAPFATIYEARKTGECR